MVFISLSMSRTYEGVGPIIMDLDVVEISRGLESIVLPIEFPHPPVHAKSGNRNNNKVKVKIKLTYVLQDNHRG